MGRWILAVLAIFVPVLVADAQVCPESTGVLAWEPEYWGTSEGWDVLVPAMWFRLQRVTEYNLYREREESFSPIPQRCTLDRLRLRLSTGKGIILVSAHGRGLWWVTAECMSDPEERDARADLYSKPLEQGGYGFGANIHAQDQWLEHDQINIYTIDVYHILSTLWCQEFMQGSRGGVHRQGISFVSSCGAGVAGYNLFNSEVSFGWTDTVTDWASCGDVGSLFSLMIGDLEPQHCNAAIAFAVFSQFYDSPPLMVKGGGEDAGATELCPRVVCSWPYTVHPMFDQNSADDSVYFSKGMTGHITFSSRMAYDPDQPYSNTGVTVSGGLQWADGGAPHWANGRRIEFHYRDAEADCSLTVSGFLRADILVGNLYLDSDLLDNLYYHCPQYRVYLPNNDEQIILFRTEPWP